MKGALLERIADENSQNIPVRRHFMFRLGVDETAKSMKCGTANLNRVLNEAESELAEGGMIVHHEISAGYVHFAVTDGKGYLLSISHD